MLRAFSYSALNTYRSCPQKFKFQYVDKIEIPKIVSADAFLGSSVHHVLQQLYRRGSNNVLMPLEDALAMYEEQWQKVDKKAITVISDYLGIDDYQRLGREMLQKHYERYQPFNNGTLLGTELNLYGTLPNTPWKLTARIDRIWKREDGTVEICDYKTGQHLTRPNDPAFYFQMGLYQLVVMLNYPNFSDIELAQYFLRMDEVISTKLSSDEMEQLVEDIRVAIVTIMNSYRMDNFPTQEGPLCKYCNYEEYCPARRHRKILEEETEQDSLSLAQQAYRKASKYIALYRQGKTIEAEMKALRKELLELAEKLHINRFDGEQGEVSVKITQEEKFVTKTEDAHLFAELNALARELGLDDYFVIDSNVLMKDGYQKQRLSDDIRERLTPFVRQKEKSTVRVKVIEPIDDEPEI